MYEQRRGLKASKVAGALKLTPFLLALSLSNPLVQTANAHESTPIHAEITKAKKKTPPYLKGIQIKGDRECKKDTKAALRTLFRESRAHSKTVSKYLKVIECVPSGSGIYDQEEKPRFAVGDETRTASPTWYAGTIVLDANHVRLHHEAKKANPTVLVPADAWTGKEAEAICLAAQADALTEIKAPEHEIAHVNNILSTNYWDVPVQERYW
jgi:hypothetical protein